MIRPSVQVKRQMEAQKRCAKLLHSMYLGKVSVIETLSKAKTLIGIRPDAKLPGQLKQFVQPQGHSSAIVLHQNDMESIGLAESVAKDFIQMGPTEKTAFLLVFNLLRNG